MDNKINVVKESIYDDEKYECNLHIEQRAGYFTLYNEYKPTHENMHEEYPLRLSIADMMAFITNLKICKDTSTQQTQDSNLYMRFAPSLYPVRYRYHLEFSRCHDHALNVRIRYKNRNIPEYTMIIHTNQVDDIYMNIHSTISDLVMGRKVS